MIKYLSISGLIVMAISLGCRGPINEGKSPYRQEHIPWPSLADAPWPMVHHDPQGTGRSQYSGPQLGELVDTWGNTLWVFGSFSIDGENSLYFTGSRGLKHDLHRFSSSGNPEWSYEFDGIPDNGTTPLITSDGLIYTHGYKRILYVINSDGTLNRTIELDENINSNVVVDRSGDLYLSTESSHKMISFTPYGDINWQLEVPGGFHYHDLPAVFSPDGGTLYTRSPDTLYAITTGGDILWRYATVSSNQLLVDNSGHIYFHNRLDSCITSLQPSGDVRWKTNIKELGARWIYTALATIDIEGNLYFYANFHSYDGIFSLDNEGYLRWIWEGNTSTDLVSDSEANVYFSWSVDGKVHCYSLTSSGILNYDLLFDFAGGMTANSIAIGLNNRAFIPVINNPYTPIIVVQ